MDDLLVIVDQSRQLRSLAPGWPSAARNTLAIILTAAADRGLIKLSRSLPLLVAYRGLRFRLSVTNRSEIEVIKEMLVQEQYALPGIAAPSLILDLGSNIGASIAFFHGRYPEARIVGLEPDPSTFGRLASSVAGLRNVEVHPWAIARRTGPLPFRQDAQSWGSSLVATAEGGSIEVEAVSLGDLLTRLDLRQVDLLKLDVEGTEWQLFDDPAPLAAFDTVVGELHFQQPGQSSDRARGALREFDVQMTARTDTHVNFVARRLPSQIDH